LFLLLPEGVVRTGNRGKRTREHRDQDEPDGKIPGQKHLKNHFFIITRHQVSGVIQIVIAVIFLITVGLKIKNHHSGKMQPIIFQDFSCSFRNA